MLKSDGKFLANRLEIFVNLIQDPKAYFARRPDMVLPDSTDLKILSAGLYLLVDSYLRGGGIKYHHASKTHETAMEALGEIWQSIHREIMEKPQLYPNLIGVLGRGQASIELGLLQDGYSDWSD